MVNFSFQSMFNRMNHFMEYESILKTHSFQITKIVQQLKRKLQFLKSSAEESAR